MESSSTDTQQKVSRGYIGRQIDYWSKIDCIDCELSGYSKKYKSQTDLDDALGINANYTFHTLSLLRKSLSNSK